SPPSSPEAAQHLSGTEQFRPRCDLSRIERLAHERRLVSELLGPGSPRSGERCVRDHDGCYTQTSTFSPVPGSGLRASLGRLRPCAFAGSGSLRLTGLTSAIGR